MNCTLYPVESTLSLIRISERENVLSNLQNQYRGDSRAHDSLMRKQVLYILCERHREVNLPGTPTTDASQNLTAGR